MMGVFVNRIGQRFGMLVVEGYGGSNARRQSLWNCLCDCGGRSVVVAGNLTSGNTRSCGCLEIANRITHGESKTRLYHRWEKMIARITDPRSNNYRNYGGRGITVCERWLSYENFRDDMGGTFEPALWLERVDNEKGYSPENCKWVHPKVNHQNKRSNRFVEHDGVRMTVAAWAEKIGITRGLLGWRLDKGWPIHEALGFKPRG